MRAAEREEKQNLEKRRRKSQPSLLSSVQVNTAVIEEDEGTQSDVM